MNEYELESSSYNAYTKPSVSYFDGALNNAKLTISAALATLVALSALVTSNRGSEYPIE